MKQAGYSKRSYGRSSERQKSLQTKQLNGIVTDNKIRGNPQQFVEKYLTLARDATSLGDPISAENYYQFADHYYRLAVASRPTRYSRLEKRSEENEVQEDSTPLINQNESLLD